MFVIVRLGMAIALRFPHFVPKVSVVTDPGKRAAYSSSEGLRKGRNSPRLQQANLVGELRPVVQD